MFSSVLLKILPGPQSKAYSQTDKFEYLEDYDVHEANTSEEGGKSNFL